MPDEDVDVNADTSNGGVDESQADDQGTDTTKNDNTQDGSADETDDVEKLKEQNKKLFERAKKAEAEAKTLKTKKPEPKTETASEPKEATLSTKDVLYLAKADIHEDDMDEVLEWAKFKKISVSEAHKQLKPKLDASAEQRKSSQVANAGGSKRTSSKPTAERILADFNAGIPPKTPEDWEALHKARMTAKK